MESRKGHGEKTAYRKSGFTLLEVLIALSLFFVAVTYFSMAYLNTLGAMNGMKVNQSLEQDLATVRRQALLLSDLEEVEAGGTVVTGEHGLARWDIEYEPTNVADLFQVTLRMEFEAKDDEEIDEVEEQFYLTRPTWSDPLERDDLRTATRERLAQRQQNLRQ